MQGQSQTVYNRFLFRQAGEKSSGLHVKSYIRDYDLIGIVKSYDAENGIATITQRNRFFKGDEIEIIQPMKPFFVQTVDSMCDENGNEIEVANHAEQIVNLKRHSLFARVQCLERKSKKSEQI